MKVYIRVPKIHSSSFTAEAINALRKVSTPSFITMAFSIGACFRIAQPVFYRAIYADIVKDLVASEYTEFRPYGFIENEDEIDFRIDLNRHQVNAHNLTSILLAYRMSHYDHSIIEHLKLAKNILSSDVSREAINVVSPLNSIPVSQQEIAVMSDTELVSVADHVEILSMPEVQQRVDTDAEPEEDDLADIAVP